MAFASAPSSIPTPPSVNRPAHAVLDGHIGPTASRTASRSSFAKRHLLKSRASVFVRAPIHQRRIELRHRVPVAAVEHDMSKPPFLHRAAASAKALIMALTSSFVISAGRR